MSLNDRRPVKSPRIPVYRDAGFELSDAETTAAAFSSETGNERVPEFYIYSRYRNPTVVAAEEEIMKLECSEWALLAQSGMAAADIALSIFQEGRTIRPWLFFNEIYGGTISFAETVLKKRRGLDIHYFSPINEKYDLSSFKKVMQELQPAILFIEAISNPMLIVPDTGGIIRIAKKIGAKVIVDNTFATPHLWKPLCDGADIVIHSATKYLSGHGNLTAGLLCGNDHELMTQAVEYRKYAGHMLSADDAYRLHTQVQTFGLRFSQQCTNAAKIAEILSKCDIAGKVLYPGLKNHPTHLEASVLFSERGYGGMVTFDFKGSSDEQKRKRRDDFIRAVSHSIKLIPSLGDPATILMPVEAVWGAKYHEPGMIRISAGFENTEELTETISKALSSLN